MNPEHWDRISSLLDRLWDLSTEERDSALDQLKATDPTLCRQVVSLLSTNPSTLFESPPSAMSRELNDSLKGDPVFDNSKAGRYEVLREIARGGMGAIFLVRDPQFDRSLALKVLLPGARTLPQAESLFLNEARLTAQLQHPGIPPIHDSGQLPDGSPFFVMKWIEGKTLSALIQVGGQAWEAGRVGVFEQICQTLAYAHDKRIVHRDVKPGNIMVGSFGEVQIMDWGLAVPQHSADSTDLEGLAGTPSFMAPEQARGEAKNISPRSDVFALGGILVAMFTGRAIHQADTLKSLLGLARDGNTAEALEAFQKSGADGELISIVAKCLQFDPALRFANAGELALAVSEYRERLDQRLRQAEREKEAAVIRALEEKRRRRIQLGLSISVGLLILGALGAWAWIDRAQKEQLARGQSLSAQVQLYLDEVQSTRKELLSQLNDPFQTNRLLTDLSPWEAQLGRMEAKLGQAQTLAASDPGLIEPEQITRLDEFIQRIASDRDDYRFALEADALRADLLDQQTPNPEERYRSFSALFEKRGWDLFHDRDLASRLAQSPIRLIVLASLDDLVSLRLDQKVDARDQRFLTMFRVSNDLEESAKGKELRDPASLRDRSRVDRLTTGVDPASFTPQSLRMMASLRKYHGLDPLPLLRTALLQYPSDLWLLFQLGEVAHKTDTVEGFAAQRAALALRPQSYAMLNNLGTKYMRMQDYATAADYFRKSLSLKPDSKAPAQNLAFIECEWNPNPTTIAALDLARMKSKYPDHFSYLGTKYAFIGNEKKSLECFEKADQLAPKEPYYRKLLDSYRATLNSRKILKVSERASPRDWSEIQRGWKGELSETSTDDQYFGRTLHKREAIRISLRKHQLYTATVKTDCKVDLTLEDDQFAVLAGSRDSRPTSKQFSFFVPEDGIYRLCVSGSTSQARGVFEVVGGKPIPDPPLKNETGALTRKDDTGLNRFRDYHRIELNQGETILVEMRAKTFEPRLDLYDDQGNKLFESMRVNPFDPRYTRLEYQAGKSGKWTIALTSASPDQIGDYTLHIRRFVANSPLGNSVPTPQ